MTPAQSDGLRRGHLVSVHHGGQRVTAEVSSVSRLSGTQLRRIGVTFTNPDGIKISTSVLHSQAKPIS